VTGRKGEHQRLFDQLKKEGFVRVRVNGEFRELEDEIRLDKKKKHTIEAVVDRLIVKPGLKSRLTDSVELAVKLSQGFLRVVGGDGSESLFSERFSCDRCDLSLPELTPQLFSFNNPQGACPTCDGLGTKMYFDPELIVPNPTLSLREGAILPWENRSSLYFQQTLEALMNHYHFDLYTRFKDLPSRVQEVLLHGSGNEVVRFHFEKEGRRHFFERPFEGVIPNLDRRYRETDSAFIREELERFMNVRPCPSCGGARLKRESLAVKISGLNLYQVTRLSVKETQKWFNHLELNPRQAQIGRRLLKEILDRLEFLVNVGLDYLSLDRSSATLSGGEGQRIRLATQIGSRLMGVLYILDEPSIGLHQRDNLRLLETLRTLRDLGNTVLVVEHDAETIRAADYVIDMGPGAGEQGGEVVFSGPPEQLIRHAESLTGKYLSGRLRIEIPAGRRPGNNGRIQLRGASENNLKNIKVSIPLGVLTCVTGVSGSGKSTLIIDTLYRLMAQRLYRSKERAGKVDRVIGVELIDKVINIDQSPIGRTPRSNPATYTGLFTFIRDLFARTPEARTRGYKPGRFSFNVRGGRCPACNGDGLMKIEMHFLPDVYVTCEVCQGSRYNRDTLDIQYKGRDIARVLEMTVDQAVGFFEAIPSVREKLETLSQVGLGYIRLGQAATTLSGGEAQRIKLSRELSKRHTGRTLYILDEPTTGLHFADVQKLLEVLKRLVDLGNTVVVIEHNLDVIKTADYIIDLGPEGGDAGGEVIGCGTPEELAALPHSFTGQFLKQVLGNPGLVV
jgi:excinuclease ABC subunit A